MLHKRKWGTTALVLFIALLLSALANAETSFHADTPKGAISTADAAKRLGKAEQLYRCRAVKLGPSINPVSVPKSKTTWHLKVDGDLGDKVAERLASGAKVVKCDLVAMDRETARVRKAE